MRRTQPDAFKSLSDASLTPERVRGMREASAPPAFGRTDEFGALGPPASLAASPSRSVNDWEDQIIPTVARKLQQQQLLAGNSTRTHEALIDTWDRNGLPLSQTDFAAQQRAARLEAEARDAQVHQPEPAVQPEPERHLRARSARCRRWTGLRREQPAPCTATSHAAAGTSALARNRAAKWAADIRSAASAASHGTLTAADEAHRHARQVRLLLHRHVTPVYALYHGPL